MHAARSIYPVWVSASVPESGRAIQAALGAEGELEFFDPDFEEWAAPSNLAELQGKRVRVVGPNGPVEVRRRSPLPSRDSSAVFFTRCFVALHRWQ